MSGTEGLDLRTAAGPLDATVSVPPSKSLTHRALALAALADGGSLIESPLLADDTIRMAAALRALGARLEFEGPGAPGWKRAIEAPALPGPAASGGALRPGSLAPEVSLRVGGRGGRLLAPAAPLGLGGSGTAVRLLTALAALAVGEVVIDGDARMRQRPIGPLLEALAALGVEARSIDGSGCPPVRVRGERCGEGRRGSRAGCRASSCRRS